MSWRPEGWKNPFPIIEPIPENVSAESAYVKHLLFEAGADAILTYLLNKGIISIKGLEALNKKNGDVKGNTE